MALKRGFSAPALFERLCVSCDRAAATNTALTKSFRGGFRLKNAVCSIAGVFHSSLVTIAPMVKRTLPWLRHN
ncbi:hypothetical protein QUB37_22060 [Microcoleus sp. AT3-A2]